MSEHLPPNNDAWSEPEDHDEVETIPARPAGSAIEIKHFDDGISITVPPSGLWKGSRGLFGFGVLWCGFMTVFTPMMLGADAAGKGEGNVWLMLLAMAAFWLVGIGMLLSGINMGRRQAGLAVAGGTLMVLQTGLFSKKQREWKLGDIAAIRVAPTGLEVNDTPVMALQIHDTDGHKLSLLAGRTDEELEWLAHELRTAAGVPA